MNKELILDTTAKYLVVGLASDDKIIAKTQYVAWLRQSELTVPEIVKILNENDTSIKEITRIVVTNGPGSYTGIRIALTIAKVLALALDIPICVISSLQALCGSKGLKIALIDARSKRAYYGIYNNGVSVTKDGIATIDEIKEMIKSHPEYEVVGDTNLVGLEDTEVDLVKNLFELGKMIPDASDIDSLVPVYLKEVI